MSTESSVERIDSAISTFFSSGNIWTFLFATILVVLVLWPLITGHDPDIHPFLLSRQAQASPVRQPNESAVFRANEIPYGYPLRKGLGVKDPGAAAWSPGRDGDLRDIWRKAVLGAVDDKGTPLGKKGKIRTILGQEKVVDQSLDEVTQAINAIGRFVQSKGAETVAVSLSNSVELLVLIFASAFYGFKPVLLPYALDPEQFHGLVAKASPDLLIAEAATVDLTAIATAAPSVKNVIWVVKDGSRHIDWTENPDGTSHMTLSTWHNTVDDSKSSSQVPASEKDSKTGPLVTCWKGKNGRYELVEYPSAVLVAGIGGLLSTMVRQYGITNRDTILSTASFVDTYALCWVLAALYSNASIALNSVAGDTVDLTLAVTGVSPTIIVSSSGTITKHHEKIAAYAPGIPQKISNYFQKRDLLSGYMSSKKPGGIEPKLSALRVLLISQRDTDQSRVTSSILAGLRVALGTRIGYALTSAAVAGAVTQSNILDYRDKGSTISVGTPVTSLELYVTGDEQDLDQSVPKGRIAVKGPSVVGGQAQLDVSARIDVDRTLALL